MTKIKPCKTTIVCEGNGLIQEKGGQQRIWCRDCQTSTRWYDNLSDAIAEWNTRVEQPGFDEIKSHLSAANNRFETGELTPQALFSRSRLGIEREPALPCTEGEFLKEIRDKYTSAHESVNFCPPHEVCVKDIFKLCNIITRQNNEIGDYIIDKEIDSEAILGLRAEVARLENEKADYEAGGGLILEELGRKNESLQAENEELSEDRKRLNWLDLHTAFVADGEYRIGPYKIGELRKMADDGIAIDKSSKALKEKEDG